MQGELALLVLIVAELFLVSTIAKWGREWLYGAIVVNLLLVGALGMKVVTIFGFETNSGNIFYSSALFAVLLLVEMYGIAMARRGVLLGAIAVICFLIACQFVIAMPSAESSLDVDAAMHQLFDVFSRVSFASLLALLVSLNLAISLYVWMKTKHGDNHLWVRNLTAVGLSQLIDSLLFFSIAFLGTVPASAVLQFMITGFMLKVLFGLASTPFFYSNRVVIIEKEIT